METKKISQKEYLKKYLKSGGDKKSKTKKKLKIKNPRVTVIDDDINLENIRPMDDAEYDIINATEDAPMIVGVIDERGPVDFADKKKWKIIADDGDGNVAVSSNRNNCDSNDSYDKVSRNNTQEHLSNKLTNHDRNDSTEKEQLRSIKQSTSKHNKSRKRHRSRSDSDSSSQSDSKNDKRSSKSKRHSDISPPRSSHDRKNSVKTSQQTEYDSDLDVPRVSHKSSRERKSKHDRHSRFNSESDSRHARYSDFNLSPSRKSKNNSRERKQTRDDSDSDLNLPRKSSNNSRESNQTRHDSDLDLSPPRKSKHHSRESKQTNHRSELNLSHEKSKHHSHESRKFRHDHKHSSRRHESGRSKNTPPPSSSDADGRLKKTLDGKTAGLQDAAGLREETVAHKQKEKEVFNNMSAEVSGYGQAPVMRDRKTGKRRDLKAEELERLEKEKRQQEINDKYSKWGRGLKQVDDRAEKLKQDSYEMTKPLARYADDADLDALQRAEEREGDPMLNFIKEKQIKEGKRQPDKPSYQGSYTPNRFGIKPGYRWDGVDRSNGYEKKWFEAKNARVAVQEEAYKWSTSDM
ncbi:BUD13 homolog [Microplitis mediator]|uniref:BUD13 homolog n=1 Tax=Microplitis mediator TaxID=375433 RepID=UPI002557C127|nr:BUD13 homolog [Microplitis mediator]